MPAKNHTPPKKILNSWKEYHESLNDTDKLEARKKVMDNCEWSLPTFYRRMGLPLTLRFWEKKLVANAYGKKVEALFPEEKKQKQAA